MYVWGGVAGAGIRVQPVSMNPNARYGMAALHQGGTEGMVQALHQFGPAPGAKKMLDWEVRTSFVADVCIPPPPPLSICMGV